MFLEIPGSTGRFATKKWHDGRSGYGRWTALVTILRMGWKG